MRKWWYSCEATCGGITWKTLIFTIIYHYLSCLIQFSTAATSGRPIWILSLGTQRTTFSSDSSATWAPQLRITGLWWFDSAAWHDGRVSGRPKSAKSPWWMHFEKLSNRSWSRKMADGVNCYQSKALISLCRWSRNWSWPLKHLEFSQRARFVFLCEVDAFFWTFVWRDQWHLTILLCQKSCAFYAGGGLWSDLR